MSDSPQDVYAKHLLHAGYGYPLRIPEPRSTLPDYYQDSGLQVGDVGTVDRDGQFDVLFNIYKCKDNLLHDRRGVPKNFQPIKLQGDINSRDNVIPPRPIHSRGIERILESNKQSSVDYEFKSSVPAGAILILPHGAKSQQLSSPEQLREVATKSALDWYEFAQTHCDVRHHDRSLYLVTGFYKTPSWSLGSFNDPASVEGTIQARKDGNSYLLDFTFVADHRRSCPDGDTMTFNQTVFITGFKITISSWLSDPVVLRVTESETPWSILARLFKACLNWLPDFSSGYKQHGPISVEHKPSLSQPFHPSDIINRFLLSKEPNAKVAITHDSDWMDMLKGGLTHEELLHEDSLGMFLAKHYSISVDSQSENTTVFLQGKADDTMNSVSSIVDPRDSSPELEFLPPTPTLDNPWIVITSTHPFFQHPWICLTSALQIFVLKIYSLTSSGCQSAFMF
ncbi:hypothetical protein F5141DRAFT_1165267 [Pisolithus sp. B1]|nr:hypothetical protein F5141DRAFT_1165267 [Pisolithus sp. B1]